MDTKGSAYEYLPVSRSLSYSGKKHDDVGSIIYAQNKPHMESPKTLKKDEHIRPPSKLRNSRMVRLAIFLVLEAIWLGFGLAIYFRPILIPSSHITVGSLSTSSTSLFGSLGILWQSLASLTIADVVQEIYSGEWHEMIKKKIEDQGRTIRDLNTVSTLVSGRILQARHAFRSGHSTLRYRLAVIISLLLIALSVLAPNAISISSVSSERPLMIGATSGDITQNDVLNMTYGQLLLEVAQFESVIQLDGSPPEFVIKDVNGNPSSNVLFGMPLRSDLGDTAEITRLSYVSDAVSYNFTCQWLAPTFISEFTWSFGGDMTGTIDRTATFVSDAQQPGGGYFGIYPFNITDGVGSTNGSFAWFISSFHNNSDGYWQGGQLYPLLEDVFIDLSSIPTSGRTSGNITQSDWDYIESVELPSNTSTTDTVLFCDPHIQISRVEVDMSNDGSALTFRPLGDHGSTPVGNIDQLFVSQVLGRGLNGIPWESNVILYGDGVIYGDGVSGHLPGRPSTLGRLAADLLFSSPPVQATAQSPVFGANSSITSYSPANQTIYNPRSLSDIGSNLNSYTSTAGMNTYLSGSLGNHTVPATGIYANQRLVVNWPQWFANLFIVLVVAGFVILVTIRDARKGRELVPLTLSTMKKYLREYHADLEE